MRKRWIPSPVSCAIAMLAVLAWVYHNHTRSDRGGTRTTPGVHELDSSAREKGWFIKPFLTPSGASGVALDGGEIPFLTDAIPELLLGPEHPRPLHLALLVDWHSPECRKFLLDVFAAYDSKENIALPPVRMVILPVASSRESRAIHEMAIRVHAMTPSPDAYPDLVRFICFHPENLRLDQIREFIASHDADLLARIDAAGDVVDGDVHAAFLAAETQLIRNTSLTGLESLPQCVSMHQCLTVAGVQHEWAAFLNSAKTFQDAYQASPEGRAPITPEFGCRCQISSHRHSPWKAEVLRRFPDLHSAPGARFTLPGENSDVPTTSAVAGPQIRFMAEVHVLDAAGSRNFLSHVFEFENTGDEILEIRSIDTGTPDFTLVNWDRSLPPGGRGSFSIRFPIDALAKAAANPDGHRIWVDSNSASLTDATRGTEVMIRLR